MGKKVEMISVDAIPARTLAAGKQAVESIQKDNPTEAVNFDMQLKYKTTKTAGIYWPAVRGQDEGWRHSDVREVAYSFIYKIFDSFVSTGGLK